MAPFAYPHHVHSDTVFQHHPSNKHFTNTTRTPACDHCTYFQDFVHRTLHPPADNNLAHGPRSLHSIAVEEVRTEALEHESYLAWSHSRHIIAATAAAQEAVNPEKSLRRYAAASDTLTAWIEGSAKEELLVLLEWNRNESEDMESLRHEGIFYLRAYMRNRRSNKPAPKMKAAAIPSTTQSSHPIISPPSCDETLDPRTNATAQRIQAHASVKPPQAAQRKRVELARWYDSKKALLLKDCAASGG